MNDPVLEPDDGEDWTRPEGDLRSAILERLDRSAERLEDPALDPARVVHEVRKDLKRIRALLRLVRPVAPTRRLEKDCAAAARELSHLRDADALLETLDRLAERAGGGEAGDAVAAARARFAAGRGRFRGEPGLPAEVAGPVAATLRSVSARVRDLPFEAVDAAVLDDGLEGARARAVRAWRRVTEKRTPARLHEFRKDVKRELYQRELCGRPFDRMDRAMLRQLAEVLGELQDLEVLRRALRKERCWQGPVRRLAKETRRELTSRAERLAAARYGETEA